MIDLQSVFIAYSQPHRKYHNLTHIARIMSQFVQLGIDIQQATIAQQYAILLHDVVYDPKSTTNEEDSAVECTNLILVKTQADKNILLECQQIILSTKDHISKSKSDRLVIDLDLHFLGLPWQRFIVDSARIREEYSHLSDDEWKAGRICFCEEMLERAEADRLFYGDIFKERFNTQAIKNFKMMLLSLR